MLSEAAAATISQVGLLLKLGISETIGLDKIECFPDLPSSGCSALYFIGIAAAFKRLCSLEQCPRIRGSHVDTRTASYVINVCRVIEPLQEPIPGPCALPKCAPQAPREELLEPPNGTIDSRLPDKGLTSVVRCYLTEGSVRERPLSQTNQLVLDWRIKTLFR